VARSKGMSWKEIMAYERIIVAIATKYSGDMTLRDDVVQETMLRLRTDKNLDTSRFDPMKKDAAIRTTIRNKVIQVLTSRAHGRFKFDSLDGLLEYGFQLDSKGVVRCPPYFINKHGIDDDEDGGYGAGREGQ